VKADPLIGRELAGYRIEELIGRGGMGVVYRAEHLMLGRHDALKLLASDLTSDDAFRERFLRESRIAATIEHTNVIPIHHAGEVDGVLYLAMRYVRGSDLRRVLEQRRRLEPDETVSVIDQVSSALDAAHERGLIHRDVKPANILIEASGHVYLTDFGIAKHTRTRGGLTKTGSFLGTLDYAAPEQIEGKPVDGRVDVYALGCALYQCLTGVAPYEKDSEVQLIYAHLLERPTPITTRHPGLPAGLDAVLDRALAKSRDDRYATCGELAADLRTALAGGTVRLPAPSAAPPTRAAVPPRAEPPLAAPPLAERPRRAEPPPPPPAPTAPLWRRLPVLLGVGAAIVAAIVIAVVLASGGSSNAFPNTAEKSLLALIPSPIRPTCVRLPVPASAAAAAVSCTAGVERPAYYAFPSASAARSFYGAKLPALFHRDRGSCSDLPRSGERPYSVGGKSAGRIFCSLASSVGPATIGWVDEHAKTFTQAGRDDGNQAALYRWWAGSAGPLRSSGAKSVPAKTSAVPPGALLFQDTFSNPATGWPQVDNSQVSMRYSKGGYLILVRPANQARLLSTATFAPPLLFGDVVVRVDAAVASSPGLYSFGVVCRASSSGSYRLEVRSDGVFLIARIGRSTPTVLKATSFGSHVLRGTNHLRAECASGRGGPLHLTLSLNGRTLSATDKHPIDASGGAGIDAVTGAKGNADVRFDNFSVRKP
jgi:serine/threonine-protein kinase